MPFPRTLAIVLTLALAAGAEARDIFVNNQVGDDRRGGSLPVPQGESGPCRTIAKALRIASASDRIILANTGVPYHESITLQAARHSGSERYPFRVVGNGATLDGGASLAEADWQHVAGPIFRMRPEPMSFQLLFLDDVPLAKQPAPPRGQTPELAPREWCEIEGWIYFAVEPGKLPRHYNLACCAERVAITFYDVHNVVIEDLTIRHYQLDGINCHDNVRDCELTRITANENGRSGFSVGGASRVRIASCQAAGNGVAQFRSEGYCIAELAQNKFDAASASPIVREGGRIIVAGN